MQLIFVISLIFYSQLADYFFLLLYFAILFVDFPECMNNSVTGTLAKKQVQSEYNSIHSPYYLQNFLDSEQNPMVGLIISLVSLRWVFIENP